MTPSPSPLPSPTGPQPRLGRWAAVAMIMIVLALVAGFLPRRGRQAELAAQTRSLAVATVSVVSPTPSKGGAGLTIPAEVKPWVEAPIYARASGYVKRWLVDLGAEVGAGQLLAELDTPEINQELARARAEFAQSEAALTLAKTTEARYRELLKSASVSDQEAAEKQADLALKGATVAAAQAGVLRLEELLSFSRVTAPFAGTITARKIDVGQLVTAGGAHELFRLSQIRTLRVFARLPQSMARGVAVGQLAQLTLNEQPGRTLTATLVRTAGVIDAESRTLLAEFSVDNAKREILAGSYAQIRFAPADLAPPLTLPANTLLFRAEGPRVGVVSSGSKVELRSIHLGRDFGQALEVLDGVSTNDRVILNPADSLVNGAEVRIATPTAKPDPAK